MDLLTISNFCLHELSHIFFWGGHSVVRTSRFKLHTIENKRLHPKHIATQSSIKRQVKILRSEANIHLTFFVYSETYNTHVHMNAYRNTQFLINHCHREETIVY